MRRFIPAIIAVFAVGAVVAMSASAQQGTGINAGVPEIITYRGYLEDGSTGTAVPVNGNKNLTFRIFSQAAGGTALWTCGPAAVPVLGGHFQVLLGGTTCPFTGATGPEKLFDRNELYLEIAVEGTTMTGRQRLTAAPYAVSSAQAENFRVSGTMQVSGVSTLASGAVISGVASPVDPWGNANPRTLHVQGSSHLQGWNWIDGAHIRGAMFVDGLSTLSGGASVTGNVTATGTVSGNFAFTGSNHLALTSTTTVNEATMTPTARSFCFLTWASSPNLYASSCQITTSGTNWVLRAKQNASTTDSTWTTCGARCISW